MFRIRRIEEAIAAEYPRQEMRCPVHLSIGQEAAAVGIAELLTKDDLMVSTHRGHAHYLAKGGSLRGLLCELYGKADGCSRGQGGSMHLVDRSAGFSGSTSIVGGTIPVGVGLAFAKKLKKEKGVVVVCLGDAAIEEGVFHEAANFASLHRLPVVFFCENNFFSCYTELKQRQPDRSMSAIATAHKMEYIGCDGNDCKHIVDWCRDYVNGARNGKPLFIEVKTYRHLEHCGPNNDDNLGYRDETITKFWLDRDPLLICEKQLKAAGEWGGISDHLIKIEDEIQAEMIYARWAPVPAPKELGAYEYKNSN
jgi:pyruvate dehydrogenase E1 component alpha subunit